MKAVLDHVGIAVEDLAAALAFYRDALGLEVEAPEEVASQRVRAHFVPVGRRRRLELLEATAPDSPIAKFIDKRGPGLHHITLRVDDIARGARAAQGARRPADRRAAAAGRRRRARRVRPPVQRARRAGRAEAGRHGASSAVSPIGSASSSSVAAHVRRYPLGDLELISLCDGFFGLDGGAMFGVVPKPLWEKKAPADERNRITLAMRPLVVRGARTMIIDAGLGDKENAKFQRHLRRRSRAEPRSHARRGRAVRRRTSTSCSPRTCTSITPAASRVRDAVRPRPPALSARAVHRPARRVGGRDAPARAEPRQLSGSTTTCRSPRPACCSSSTTTRRSCRACRVRRTGGHTMHHQMVVDRVGRQDRGLRRRPDADDGAPAGARGSWASTCIRWTRSRRRRRFVKEAIERETLVFFEHDPAIAAGYIREHDGKRTSRCRTI